MTSNPPAPPRPNIVIVLADDMGYGDVGALNPDSRIPTPHMDAVAAEGLSFTDAHAASAVCTPSRYALLTGEYCWRTVLPRGVFAGYEPPLIDPDQVTIASLLRGAGYRTAAIGKWHVGLGFSALPGAELDFDKALPWPVATREFEERIDFTAKLTGGPLELGFDEFFGTSGCPTCQPPYGWIDGDRFVEPPDVYEETAPYTGRPGMRSRSWDHAAADPTIVDRSVEFIERAAGGDAPFFMYVCLDAPHEPCIDDVVPEVARGQSSAGPRGDLVWMVDHAVGEIAGALEAAGVGDDTCLIVTSDNGALAGDRVLDDDGVEVYRTYGHDPSGGWRGHKAHIWEGGHREPMLVRWPAAIAPGRVCDDLVCLTDLVATAATLSGADLPAGAAPDSVDIARVFTGEESLQRQALVHHSQRGVFAIRSGRWKAIFDTEGSGGWPPPAGGVPVPGTRGQLYDLETDPTESSNEWDRRPDIVERLGTMLAEAKAGTAAPG